MEGSEISIFGDDVHPSAMNDAVNTSADDDDDDSDDDNDENGEDEDEFDEENKNSPENGVGNSAKPTSAFLSRRRNIRKILEEAKLSSATLDAQQQERERLQRVAAAPVDYILSAEEVFSAAELARRTKIWAESRPSRRSKVSYDDIVTLSSDEDEPRRDPKRRKQTFDSEPKSENDSDVVCLSSDEDECGPSTSFDRRPINDSESAHTNDLMNVADDEGQMLINVGHPPTDPDIFLASHLTKIIKPHQLGGVRFLYDNIIESPQRVSEGPGFGCILAHSMGLGKTLQVVSFVDIFYRHSPGKRILVLVPINTLQNWVHEFEHWLPKVSDTPNIQPRQFEVFVLGDKTRTPQQRSDVINEWNKSTGVLIMGYEMFRLLSSKELGLGKIVPTKKQNGCPSAKLSNSDEARLQKSKGLYQALIDPGADLIVCDEGHRIKNMQTTIAKALNSIKTRRRIVLTGYPLQNNMLEYWCMVNFVRPNYLGSKHEFANMFERPIKNGQCVDSTPEDVRVMRFRVHVLTNLLKGFVQRRSHSILSVALPPKKEFVLFLRKSSIQHKLYRRFVVHCREEVLDHVGSWNALKAFAVCCKIWNHPDVLHKVIQNRGTLIDNDLDLGDVSMSTASNGNSNKADAYSDDSSSTAAPVTFQPVKNSKRVESANVDYRWAEDILESYERGRPENGFKLLLTLAIVGQSVLRDDKILLFSQSLFTLDLIEEFLSKNYVPGSTELWKKNRSYFRLDGSTSASEREKLISRFNNEKSAHLFLISTRAGSLGINLVGANRVIVFDASWNPCHDAQAVCRVYRYGQKKPTFIYRLVLDNSMERTIFNRQIGKQGMAERIIDEKQVDAQLSRQDLYNLLQYDENLDVLSSSWNLDHCNIEDTLLHDICSVYQDCLSQGPVQHESLLLDRSDQILSEHEKREARRNYEREKKAMSSVGVDGASKKTYAQIAREFRLYNDRPMSKPFDNPLIRPLKCTPLPMNLRASTSFHQHPGVYGDFSNRLIDPNFGIAREEVHRVMAPCSLALPSAQVPGTSGLIVPNEAVDVIKRYDGVYVRTSNGHLLDARGSVFDQSWHLNRARLQLNGAIRPPPASYNPIQKVISTGNGDKPEEILLSDDDC